MGSIFSPGRFERSVPQSRKVAKITKKKEEEKFLFLLVLPLRHCDFAGNVF